MLIIIKVVLDLVQNCECLLVKGDAFNVTNVFSQTKAGLKILTETGWSIFHLKKGDLSSIRKYLCLPAKKEDFFKLEFKNNSTNKRISCKNFYFWQKQDEYWEVYAKIFNEQYKQLEQSHQRFLDDMIDLHRGNDSERQKQHYYRLKEFLNKEIKMFTNPKVFY